MNRMRYLQTLGQLHGSSRQRYLSKVSLKVAIAVVTSARLIVACQVAFQLQTVSFREGKNKSPLKDRMLDMGWEYSTYKFQVVKHGGHVYPCFM